MPDARASGRMNELATGRTIATPAPKIVSARSSVPAAISWSRRRVTPCARRVARTTAKPA